MPRYSSPLVSIAATVLSAVLLLPLSLQADQHDNAGAEKSGPQPLEQDYNIGASLSYGIDLNNLRLELDADYVMKKRQHHSVLDEIMGTTAVEDATGLKQQTGEATEGGDSEAPKQPGWYQDRFGAYYVDRSGWVYDLFYDEWFAPPGTPRDKRPPKSLPRPPAGWYSDEFGPLYVSSTGWVWVPGNPGAWWPWAEGATTTLQPPTFNPEAPAWAHIMRHQLLAYHAVALVLQARRIADGTNPLAYFDLINVAVAVSTGIVNIIAPNVITPTPAPNPAPATTTPEQEPPATNTPSGGSATSSVVCYGWIHEVGKSLLQLRLALTALNLVDIANAVLTFQISGPNGVDLRKVTLSPQDQARLLFTIYAYGTYAWAITSAVLSNGATLNLTGATNGSIKVDASEKPCP